MNCMGKNVHQIGSFKVERAGYRVRVTGPCGQEFEFTRRAAQELAGRVREVVTAIRLDELKERHAAPDALLQTYRESKPPVEVVESDRIAEVQISDEVRRRISESAPSFAKVNDERWADAVVLDCDA